MHIKSRQEITFGHCLGRESISVPLELAEKIGAVRLEELYREVFGTTRRMNVEGNGLSWLIEVTGLSERKVQEFVNLIEASE